MKPKSNPPSWAPPESSFSECSTKGASLNSPVKIILTSTSSGKTETLDLSTWSGECIQRFIELMYLTSARTETKSKTFVEHGKRVLVVYLPSLKVSMFGRSTKKTSIDLPKNCLNRTQTLLLLLEILHRGLCSATQRYPKFVDELTFPLIASPASRFSLSTTPRPSCVCGTCGQRLSSTSTKPIASEGSPKSGE